MLGWLNLLRPGCVKEDTTEFVRYRCWRWLVCKWKKGTRGKNNIYCKHKLGHWPMIWSKFACIYFDRKMCYARLCVSLFSLFFFFRLFRTKSEVIKAFNQIKIHLDHSCFFFLLLCSLHCSMLSYFALVFCSTHIYTISFFFLFHSIYNVLFASICSFTFAFTSAFHINIH